MTTMTDAAVEREEEDGERGRESSPLAEKWLRGLVPVTLDTVRVE